MARRRFKAPIPLGRDKTNGHATLILAIMIFVATLALTALIVAHDAAERWDGSAARGFAVQVPPADMEAGDATLDRALAVLRDTPGVAAVTPLGEAASRALLEPWLADGSDFELLPLPRLIEVELRADAAVPLDALRARLARQVPGATVGTPDPLIKGFAFLGRSFEALAALVLVLIGLGTAVTAMFATRVGLSIHGDLIELLCLIGARDRDLARVFARNAMVRGLIGGFSGLVIACGAMAALYGVADRMGAPQLSRVDLDPRVFAVLAALPIAMALIATHFARRTAVRALKRLT